ncbi:multidrug efflux SMR transporter [Salinibacterium sp. dk2585]|nr:multidrug efflux SMR transporter [Salinibacterium sp. dk2585]TXK54546.1 multidrug efflux SMR transporter [Salinibacterium sp. dk5596]
MPRCAGSRQSLPSQDCYSGRWVPNRAPGRGISTRNATRLATGENVYWLVLIISGMLEAVWATALGRSEGFTKLWPSIIFGVTLILSMGGLAFALREIPVGTGYAVWVGIGASLTVVWAMLSGTEPVSLLKVLLIMGLVGCIVGLKLVSDVEVH